LLAADEDVDEPVAMKMSPAQVRREREAKEQAAAAGGGGGAEGEVASKPGFRLSHGMKLDTIMSSDVAAEEEPGQQDMASSYDPAAQAPAGRSRTTTVEIESAESNDSTPAPSTRCPQVLFVCVCVCVRKQRHMISASTVNGFIETADYRRHGRLCSNAARCCSLCHHGRNQTAKEARETASSTALPHGQAGGAALAHTGTRLAIFIFSCGYVQLRCSSVHPEIISDLICTATHVR
jgi:hypothetical protein